MERGHAASAAVALRRGVACWAVTLSTWDPCGSPCAALSPPQVQYASDACVDLFAQPVRRVHLHARAWSMHCMAIRASGGPLQQPCRVPIVAERVEVLFMQHFGGEGPSV